LDLCIDKLRGEAIYTSNLYALSILSCLALCSIIFIAFIKAWDNSAFHHTLTFLTFETFNDIYSGPNRLGR